MGPLKSSIVLKTCENELLNTFFDLSETSATTNLQVNKPFLVATHNNSDIILSPNFNAIANNHFFIRCSHAVLGINVYVSQWPYDDALHDCYCEKFA